MNPATLLAEALDLARECQYQIREEYLEGAGGGHCSFSGKKWLLLDVTQSAQQQLDDTLDALRCEPKLRQHSMSASMASLLVGGKRAA
jgi:Spy/CpxP family protein refolding chaperone